MNTIVTRPLVNRCKACAAPTRHLLVEEFISGGARWSSVLTCTVCGKVA